MQKEQEEITLSILNKHKNLLVANIPEKIRQDQLKLINKEWKLKDWKYIQESYSESEIIKYFFAGNKSEYSIFKQVAPSQKLLKKSVENGTNPHFINQEEATYFSESEERESTSTDHYPGYAVNKINKGTPSAQFKLDCILLGQNMKMEFTAEGLQDFAREHGCFITLRNCKLILPEVNKQIIRSMTFSPEKSGLITMKEEARKTVQRNCAKKNLPPEIVNVLAMQAEQMVAKTNFKLGRMIGDAVTEEDPGKRKRLARKLSQVCHEMLGIYIEPSSSLVGNED